MVSLPPLNEGRIHFARHGILLRRAFRPADGARTLHNTPPRFRDGLEASPGVDAAPARVADAWLLAAPQLLQPRDRKSVV